MAINQNDIEFALYVLNQAIYTGEPLNVRDCVLIKNFIEALQEHQTTPTENVKSREWRASVYRKLLEDPEALAQFTQQAIEKFGVDMLASMVAPEIRERIVANVATEDILESLDRSELLDLFDRIVEKYPDFVDNSWNRGYDQGFEEGQSIGYEKGVEETEDAYTAGYNQGIEDALEGS